MSKKYGSIYSVLFVLLFSCSVDEQFPSKISEKTDANVVSDKLFYSEFKTTETNTSAKKNFSAEIDSLLLFKKEYDTRNKMFNLAEMEKHWDFIVGHSAEFDFESIRNWIGVTGFLFEITGNAKYGQELDETAFYSGSAFSETELQEIQKQLIPWIFTKNLDNIYVNLFVNASIKYDHSLRGAVEITQETSYPESGKIQIRFKMQEKRYIELFIRIPDWAKGATVEEKGVKYVAVPGKYCQVLRKWSEGDFVEINLPTGQMSKWRKKRD